MAQRRSFLLLAGVITGGALVLAVLGQFDDAPRSPFAWLQFPMLLALGWGLWTTPESAPIRAGFLPFVGLSWLSGMLVELTLTVDGTGIGGVHPDTLSSFVLAQGDYIPLAVAFWSFHRWMGCRVHEATWIAIGVALTEGLIFTGSVTGALASSAPLGALFVTCYLVAIYVFFLVLPLRILGVGRGHRTRAIPLLVFLGFASAFAIRAFWGLVYSPVVSALFHRPGT